jgi:beta propeller repeat protein
VLRGSRLWWREQNPARFGGYTCSGFPDRCEPHRLNSVLTESAFAASETRMAWSTLLEQAPVYVCRVTGDDRCPRRQVGAFPFSTIQFALSDYRVVWAAPGPAGDVDIFFCEDDPLTGACPVQRLTGSSANQGNPEISGTRVVWEDDREGDIAIFGFELPSLDPVADRVVSVGDDLQIAVRGRDPAGGLLALDAAFADGTPLAARGAAFADLGDGTGALTWTPGAADVGRHVVTFAGRSAGHLTTRTSMQIEVQADGS